MIIVLGLMGLLWVGIFAALCNDGVSHGAHVDWGDVLLAAGCAATVGTAVISSILGLAFYLGVGK